MKPGLPQYGVVEQAFDQDDFRIASSLCPSIEAALGCGQEAVRRRRGRKTAAIQVDFQREDNPTHVGVVARAGDQAGLTQNLERIAQLCEPTSQAAAPCLRSLVTWDAMRSASI